MVIFLCVSGYSRKKNTYLTKFHKMDTQKNSREQKKASHRLLRIRVSVYRTNKNTALASQECIGESEITLTEGRLSVANSAKGLTLGRDGNCLLPRICDSLLRKD